MKKTALYDKHVELGAKMVPFAGYEEEISYSSSLKDTVSSSGLLVLLDFDILF